MSDEFDYPCYLASREWAKRKEAIREQSYGFCERCAVGQYQSTHHLTYANIGHEPLEDLLAVCNPCHEFLSGKSNNDPVKRLAFVVIAVSRDYLKDHMDEFSRSLTNAKTRVVGTVGYEHIEFMEELQHLNKIRKGELPE